MYVFILVNLSFGYFRFHACVCLILAFLFLKCFFQSHLRFSRINTLTILIHAYSSNQMYKAQWFAYISWWIIRKYIQVVVSHHMYDIDLIIYIWCQNWTTLLTNHKQWSSSSLVVEVINDMFNHPCFCLNFASVRSPQSHQSIRKLVKWLVYLVILNSVNQKQNNNRFIYLIYVLFYI